MSTTIGDSTLEHSSQEQRRRTPWSLVVVHHTDKQFRGKRVAVTPDEPVYLGRESRLFGEGGLDDPRVSRKHARIGLDRNGVVRIEDRGSRNGTYVNGRKLTTPKTLNGNDVVRLGSILLLAQPCPAAFESRSHPVLIGDSFALHQVLEQIEKVAARPTTVLLLGETGTGKELAARAIHDLSGRDGPFCPVNCGGMPDNLLSSELFGHVRGAFSGADRDRIGLCETASDGTLFLDEIGDASPTLQVGLLRFLQEGEVRRIGANKATKVNTRVVAATHRNLQGDEFRQDLYARIARAVIHLPPLRERLDDLPLLVDHFLGVYSEGGDGPPALHWRLVHQLLRYHWPRNVRELQMFVERLAIETAGQAGPLEMPAVLERLLESEPEQQAAAAEPAAPVEVPAKRKQRPDADELRRLLAAADGNVTSLATELGVGRNTLYRWLKAAGIDVDEFRGE